MALASVVLKILVEKKSFNFQVSLLPALNVVLSYSEQGYTSSSIVLQKVSFHTFQEFKVIVGKLWSRRSYDVVIFGTRSVVPQKQCHLTKIYIAPMFYICF